MSISKYLVASVLALSLIACGGGGGSAGSINSATSSTSTETATIAITASTVTTTISAVTPSPTLRISITNASGSAVNSLSTGGGFSAEAKILDAKGLPVANKLVSFSLVGAPVAAFSPSTALTNAFGIARVAIAPASVASVGAATIVAGASVESITVTDQTDFSVSAASISLVALSVGQLNLGSGGNTPLSTTALLSGLAASGVPINVGFGASCGRINGVDASAGAISVTTNGSGVASASYEAVTVAGNLCSGVVTLSASSAGATPVSQNINVAVPTANAITYIGASNNKIFVAGSGALEQSLVKFKVLSSAGTPLPSVPVTFSIVTNPGGLGLGASGSTGTVSAITNGSGEASISVFSGTIPGPVKLRVELTTNTAVFSESQNLTVASGPPSQRFMSLSVETFNIEGWNYDGASTRLTARVADRQGNAVEDGTVVNFTSEGGQVAVSCSTARINGISMCSVDFQTQNPRPLGGRVSVLAYLAGTKDYDDINGNNKFDPAVDVIRSIGDAYRDDNEDGSFNAGEFVVPRNGTGFCAGAGAPFPGKFNTCDQNLETTVRQQAILLFSSSHPSTTLHNPRVSTATRITANPSGAAGTVSRVAYTAISIDVRSADNPLLPMPAGTTISTAAGGVTCSVDKQFGAVIPNVNPTFIPTTDLGSVYTATLKDCYRDDFVSITVTSPSGAKTDINIAFP